MSTVFTQVTISIEQSHYVNAERSLSQVIMNVLPKSMFYCSKKPSTKSTTTKAYCNEI